MRVSKPAQMPKFTVSQIVEIVNEGDAGTPLTEILKKYGIRRRTYRKWQKKYGAAGQHNTAQSRRHRYTVRSLREIARELFSPRSFFGKMARVIAALSIVALIYDSFDVGVSKTLALIVRHYEGAVRLFLSWADPYVHALANYVAEHLHLRIAVGETWRHVFVVMWILLLRDAGVALTDGRRGVAAFRAAMGVCIAAVCSVLAAAAIGAAPSWMRNLQLAAVPYVGIYVYDIVLYVFAALALRGYWKSEYGNGATPSRWAHFRKCMRRANTRCALIFTAIGVCFVVPGVGTMSYPRGGLLVLGIATLVNLSYWVARARRVATYLRGASETRGLESWKALLTASEAGRFAFAVGSVFAWIIVFVLMNTASELLGL